jgi:hypothetical protein
MNLGSLGAILHKTVGAVAGAGGAALESVPTILGQAKAGATNPPSMPNIPAILSTAASTPHPDGGTVLDHYLQAGGAVAGGAVVNAIPYVPKQIKAMVWTGVMTFVASKVHGIVHHLEAPYSPPASSSQASGVGAHP